MRLTHHDDDVGVAGHGKAEESYQEGEEERREQRRRIWSRGGSFYLLTVNLGKAAASGTLFFLLSGCHLCCFIVRSQCIPPRLWWPGLDGQESWKKEGLNGALPAYVRACVRACVM